MENKSGGTKKKSAKRKVNRSSVSGEFVSKQYAKEHADTTETENVQAWERGKHVKCSKDTSEQDQTQGSPE